MVELDSCRLSLERCRAAVVSCRSFWSLCSSCCMPCLRCTHRAKLKILHASSVNARQGKAPCGAFNRKHSMAEQSITKHGKRKYSKARVMPGFQGSKWHTSRVVVSLPGVSCWRGAVGAPCLACRLDTTSTNAVSSYKHASQCHACYSTSVQHAPAHQRLASAAPQHKSSPQIWTLEHKCCRRLQPEYIQAAGVSGSNDAHC